MSSGSSQGEQQPTVRTWEAPNELDLQAGGELQRVPAGAGSVSETLAPLPTLIDALLQSTAAASSVSPPTGRLAELLAEPNSARALRIWLDDSFPTGVLPSREAVLSRLSREVARLDRILARQVNAILHQPRFQQLEASWRGLWMLTGQAQDAIENADPNESSPRFEVRLLTLSKRDLRRDLDGAAEFDQSQIFKKVYEQGFGMAGGHPFGALIGDYQFTNHPEDLDMLAGMAGVAAAAFAPFIAAASPELLGLDTFCSLEQPIRLTDSYGQVEYIKWNTLRDSDDSRFVGLAMPRILMRVPYDNDGSRADGFRFREEVEGLDHSRYLWGNAAYAFGSILIRSFGACRWFADIRGVERGVVGGGLVTDLPVHSFGTDRSRIAPKNSLEVSLSDFQEKELSTLGFIPICPCNDTEYSVFYSNASLQKPKTYATIEATTNAKISAMLQYTLCASRFAHYLKVLARNKIGSLQTASDLERELTAWIGRYVAADARAATDIKARYPLREAQIEVRDMAGKPGSFRLVVHLLPHFQLDGLTSTLRFSMQASTNNSS